MRPNKQPKVIMKTIDVIGIGNALVDQEFEVSEDFLAKHHLEKGMMALIEEEDQNKLIAELSTMGDLKKQCGGGSAANSLVAFAQFGGSAFYCCKVANDEAGDFYQRDLEHVGIQTNLTRQNNDGTTGRCLVMVTPDAERTCVHILVLLPICRLMNFILRQLPLQIPLHRRILNYFEIAREAIAEAKRVARENDTKIVMTCSDPAMVKYFRDGIDEILDGGVDLMFCNREEAELLTGETDPHAAAQRLLNCASTVLSHSVKKVR